MRKWNTFWLFVLLLTVLTACNQAQNTEQATKNAPVTAKAETDAEAVQEAMEEAVEESVPEAATDALIVSTTAELISSITPDAHIILKSGTYNFSALTKAEIAGAGAYVDPDLLKQGEFFVYNAPGLILEAEKSGSGDGSGCISGCKWSRGAEFPHDRRRDGGRPGRRSGGYYGICNSGS